jgi:hypothetical protein
MAGLPEPIVRGAVPEGAAQDGRLNDGEAEAFLDPPPRDDCNLWMANWA